MINQENKPNPSTPAFLLMAIALTFMIIALSMNPATSNDLFWQLRTGHEILETHHLPRFDTFSWTHPHAPWVVHEWLTFILFSAVYKLAGFGGIWLLQVIFTITTFLLLFLFVFRASDRAPLPSLLLCIIAALTASGFFQPRPQLISYLFITLLVGWILHARQAGKKSPSLWIFTPLFILWANLHAGVLVGVAILFIFGLGDFAQAMTVDRDESTARELGLKNARLTLSIGAAGALLTLINPYGWHLYTDFVATIGNTTMLNILTEWASPNFHEAFGRVLEVFFAVVLFSLALTRKRRDFAEIALLVLFAHQSLTASRNVPLFALIGTLLIARHLASTISGLSLRSSHAASSAEDSLFGQRPSAFSLVLVTVALLFVGSMRARQVIITPGGKASSTLEHIARLTIALDGCPENACRFMESEHFPASTHLYNIYGDGGFLIWRVPEYPVFIDGRADIYFGPPLDEIRKLHELPYRWRDILDTHGCDTILISSAEAQARVFLAAPDWALVYVDNPKLEASDANHPANFLIFLKRTPENTARISQYRKDCPAVKAITAQYQNYASLQ